MNNTETMLKDLAAVPAGDYDVNQRKPWWKFWHPSKRGGWGPAMAISISPSGKLVAYFESALSMWMIWGYGRGGDEELQRAFAFAEWSHRKLCRKDDAQPT